MVSRGECNAHRRLCEKSDKYYSRNAKAVKLLCSEFMQKINSQQASGRTVQQDMGSRTSGSNGSCLIVKRSCR